MQFKAFVPPLKLTTIVLFFVVAILSSSVFAECRRGTPPGGAFGIDQGRLCTFGESAGPVLPIEGNYGNYDNSTDSLFSLKERRQRLKQIVTRGSSRDGRIQQSVAAVSRPLGGPSRRFGLVIR